MFERIDRGITTLLHCPGFRVSKNLKTEDIPVNLYFSPREMTKPVSDDVACMIQFFGTRIARPHLYRFQSRCAASDLNLVPLKEGDIFFSFHSFGVLIHSIESGLPIHLDNLYRIPPAPARGYPGYTVCQCCPDHILRHVLDGKELPPSLLGNISPAAIKFSGEDDDASEADSSNTSGSDEEWDSEHERLATQFDDPVAIEPLNEPTAVLLDGLTDVQPPSPRKHLSRSSFYSN
jgi:hypothetical protein